MRGSEMDTSDRAAVPVVSDNEDAVNPFIITEMSLLKIDTGYQFGAQKCGWTKKSPAHVLKPMLKPGTATVPEYQLGHFYFF